MKTILYKYFASEIKHNPNLYVDVLTNTLDFTLLAESYLYDNNIEDENEVFEAVIDWFNGWTGKTNYNN